MRKTRLFWIVLLIVLLAAGIGAAALRKPAPAASAAAGAPQSLELLASDVTTVRARDLRQTLPLSGALRAVSQAAVKARVAGEVREVLVREGEAVKAGQVLVRMDATEYQARAAQARGALAAARGQLDIAIKSRDNNRALLERGFISRNAFDNAASQYAIAQANVDSANAALAVTQKTLADTTVRAPIAGLASNRTVQPGEKVAADFHLVDIVDLRRMEMEAAVPTSDIQRIALGQELRLTIEGVTAPFTGKVARINPSTQAGSRSIIVYVEIENPQGILRAGMFGEAQLTLTRRDGVLTAPASAIRKFNDQTVVHAIERGVLQRVPVTIGIHGDDGEGSAVEILSGLAAGSQIVRNNLGNLAPGTPVTVAAAIAPAAAPQVAPQAAPPAAPAAAPSALPASAAAR